MSKPNLLVLVNESMTAAEMGLKTATTENIIERCREYLKKLLEYRNRLYDLRGTEELNLNQSSPVVRELVAQTRKAVLTALRHSVDQVNETEALLRSFTEITGYQAAETFNHLKYQGFSKWELRAGGLRPIDRPKNKVIPVKEAVETASLLRREAYVAKLRA